MQAENNDEIIAVVANKASETVVSTRKVKLSGKRGRKPKYDYIPIPENDTDEPEENKPAPIQKEKYSSQYYQEHKNIKVICPVCLTEVQKYSIGKHQKTKTCLMVKDFRDKYNVVDNK